MFYFTTKDANLVLPDVIKKFETALEKKNEISKLEQKLQMILSTTNHFAEYIVRFYSRKRTHYYY